MPSLEPGEVVHSLELRLDDEFEKTATLQSESLLGSLSGPSSMNCTHGSSLSEL